MKKISLKKQERINKNKSLIDFSTLQINCYLNKKELSQLKGGDGVEADQVADLG